MSKHEPIRHHYVPRFLLKPFCFEDTKINYYDKNTGEVSVKDTKDIFVEKNFYRDDINNGSEPMKLEKDLARFEGEISSIIRKFLTGNEIVVTDEEYEKLQLFFAVMQYRGRKIKNEFSEDIKGTGVHTLRHTFASRLFAKGVDVKTVSELLGHSEVGITYDTYIHLIQEQQAAAVDVLENVL